MNLLGWFPIILMILSSRIGCGSPQRHGGQGGHGGGLFNANELRLGLLADQLGVPPVPGASSTGNGGGSVNPINPPTQRESCRCMPIAQSCSASNSGGNVGSGRPNDGAGLINIRIVNMGGSSNVCGQDLKICCDNVHNTGPNLHSNTGGGNIGNGNNGLIQTSCGVQSPILRSNQNGVADLGEYPWMALVLGLEDEYLGGGALISPQWVLSAAHKIDRQSLKVRLGDHDVASASELGNFRHVERFVSQIILHPQYNRNVLNLFNDVALLRLSEPVIYSQLISPVCLPEQSQQFNGRRCFVSGWGQNAFTNGKFQNLMKEVDVTVIDHFACQTRFQQTRLGPDFVFDQQSFLCAGGEQGKDACTGDGGSPLVCLDNNRWTVVGMVAWGIGCAQNQIPGAYVNVANYANFIKHHTGI